MDYGGESACPFRRQNNKRAYDTMTEAHRSYSPSGSLFTPHVHDLSNEPFPPAPQSSNHLALPPRPSIRFPGDGLDFRIPANFGDDAAQNDTHDAVTIDLTNDDEPVYSGNPNTASSSRAHRLPRYDRNIIGISSDDEGDDDDTMMMMAGNEAWQRVAPARIPPSTGTPSNDDRHILARPWEVNLLDPQTAQDDVQFIEARPRSQTDSHVENANRLDTPNSYIQHNPVSEHVGPFNSIDLTVADVDLTSDLGEDTDDGHDDDVLLMEASERERFGPVHAIRRLMTGTNYLPRAIANHPFLSAQDDGPLFMRREPVRSRHLNRPGQPTPATEIHVQSLDMIHTIFNYEETGFDLTTGRPQQRTQKYHPPDPAKDGFTRNPGEDEIVVCPNCGDELGMGEVEAKQQIWVIKGCGHAYCGSCAQNRPKPATSRKGKARATEPSGPQPLKTCVVDGCKASAQIKNMIHVFFGN